MDPYRPGHSPLKSPLGVARSGRRFLAERRASSILDLLLVLPCVSTVAKQPILARGQLTAFLLQREPHIHDPSIF